MCAQVFLCQVALRHQLLVLTHKRLLCLRAPRKLLAAAALAASPLAEVSSADRVAAFAAVVRSSSVEWTVTLQSICTMRVLNRHLQLGVRQGEDSSSVSSVSLALQIPERMEKGGSASSSFSSSPPTEESVEEMYLDRMMHFVDTLQQVWLKSGGGNRSPPVVTGV